MKVLRGVAFALSLFAANPVFAATAAYPTEAHPKFKFDYPSKWTLERGENDTDFLTLRSPSGVLVQLSITADKQADRSKAAESFVTHIKEHYAVIELAGESVFGSPGPMGSMIVGSGLDSDRVSVVFAAYFLPLPNGELAHMSVVANMDDQTGKDAAGAVMNSVRSP